MRDTVRPIEEGDVPDDLADLAGDEGIVRAAKNHRVDGTMPTMSQIVALIWSTREAVKLMVMTDRC